ncbi:MAG TPA: transcription antitermination protein NusB [Candidatus Gallibacteroides avistercoris]|uniref:Transcription antitermination protein NusB n=1 Tax=Candidatus Gallibacteroides avistercoris TaxID=2840833 RepID=A0A9D1M8V3_9BACT|nr:transcription antitermination protein NusB [Candidatus Gallibacteroides avistercoris]
MVNRVLIRIKVVQILYSYYLKKSNDLAAAEKELIFSLNKSYELYHLLLLLLIALTREEQLRIDTAKNKKYFSASDSHLNMKLADNLFVAKLAANKKLQEYVERQKISWAEESDFLRYMLNKIKSSDLYGAYVSSAEQSFETDREFWKKVFKTIIVPDENFLNLLESQSLYWNDDLDIISTFVLKSIKKYDEQSSDDQELLPMFKDDDDLEFARKLFRESVLAIDRNRNLIDLHAKNWEIERVALMDVVIMSVALVEIETFPEIPLKVSLNEYIEIAKSYSTAKSGHFINGILDSIIVQLKKEGKLTK